MIRIPEWHARMYDAQFADKTINSSALIDQAEKEISDLIRTLSLAQGARVLDVPCGTGRHSKVFGKSGFDVTAIDINPMLIEKARQNCTGLPVKFIKGSMSELRPYRQQFDLVVNLFSSFGYFSSDDDNAAILKEMSSALISGGTLVIHNIDRDWLMRAYQPVSWEETDTIFSLEARKYDPETKYNEVNEIRIDKTTNVAQRTYHRMRLYSKDEMIDLMTRSGLVDVKVYGGFDGKPFIRGESTHPVYVARKK